MALRESEAIVLRTYPLREADLLVTLFTRAEGKVRGVARSAKKSKRRFGGALGPKTYVRAFYDVRERQELARLEACEGLESPLATEVSSAHVSAARGRFAGHAVYPRGRQSARGGAVGKEVEAALWRSAGADDLCTRVL